MASNLEETRTEASVAVVVVHYGDPANLDVLWRSLQRQTRRPHWLLLWNNGPSKSVREFEGEGPSYSWHGSGDNLGFGEGINRLAEVCRADIVIVCNPDLELDPHCVERLTSAFEARPDTVVVGAALLDGDEPPRVNAYGLMLTWDGVGINPDRNLPAAAMRSADEDSPYLGPSGALFAVHLPRWRARCGGPLFPAPLFLYCEDVALGIKLRLNGLSVPMRADARAKHQWSTSTGKRSGLKLYYVERNRLWLLRALGGRALAFASLPFTVARYGAYVLAGVGGRVEGETNTGLLGPFLRGLAHGLFRTLPAELEAYLGRGARLGLRRFVAPLAVQLKEPVKEETSAKERC